MAKAIQQMQDSHTKTLDVRPLRMDMVDLKSVKDAAEEFMKEEAKLDILINNAGVSISFSVQAQTVGKDDDMDADVWGGGIGHGSAL